MHSNSPQASVPGHPNGVNVHVHVNTSSPSAAPPSRIPRWLGYAVIGLFAIGFIVGQLVVGGVITFALP
ncbi:hypothetical protein ACIQLK_13400 [Microbacterium sp. NPDC091382]|uniref:hypothetical protein n=1 Tax=Microbacterium sp. NPDC091382 TaxID=3364210 RepID=UPI00381949F1